MNYKDAGVDIELGDELASRFGDMSVQTLEREGTNLTTFGGFGAVFQIPRGYTSPVLTASCDGVGTKLKLVGSNRKVAENVGIDLVGMVTNDILCNGSEPLFMLDYIAAGKLHFTADLLTHVMKGIVWACKHTRTSLLGGETAEMPLMYGPADYDLAGFGVGVVEEDLVIDPRGSVHEGLKVVGIQSNGIHSNGFSLVNRIVSENGWYPSLEREFSFTGGFPLREWLTMPTVLYTKPVRSILEHDFAVHGMSHITGGGLVGNLERILPCNTAITLDRTSWAKPGVFDWIQTEAHMSDPEMYRTFNMGIGFAMIVDPEQAELLVQHCRDSLSINAWVIGDVVKREEHMEAVSV